MPLHCKACDAPLEADTDFVCSTCLSHAMRLVPRNLLEQREELQAVELPKEAPKQKEKQGLWTKRFLKAA